MRANNLPPHAHPQPPTARATAQANPPTLDPNPPTLDPTLELDISSSIHTRDTRNVAHFTQRTAHSEIEPGGWVAIVVSEWW